MLIQSNLFYRLFKSPIFYFLLFNLYYLLRIPFSVTSIGIYAVLFIGVGAYFLELNLKITKTLVYKVVVLLIVVYEVGNIIFYKGNLSYYTSVFFRNVNLVSTFLVCILLNLEISLLNSKRISFFLILLVLVLAILSYFECRSAIISLIAGMLVILSGKWKSFSTTIKTTLSILLFSISIICLVLFNKKINSVTGRLLVYKVSILKNENKIFGYGGNSFAIKFPSVLRNYFVKTDGIGTNLPISTAPEYAFNEFIQLYFECGLLACVMFTLVLFPLPTVLYNKQNNGILAPLLSLIINALFSYTFHNIILYVLFVLSLADVHRINFRERSHFHYKKNINRISLMLLLTGLTFGVIYRINESNRITLSKTFYNECNAKTKAKYANLFPFYQNKPRFILDYSNFLMTNCFDTIQAQKMLLTSISINPEYNTLLTLGEIHYYSNDYFNAEKYFKKAHAFMPNRFIAMDYLLNLSIIRHNSLQAKLYAEKIIKTPVKINSPFVNLAKHNAQNYLRNYVQ